MKIQVVIFSVITPHSIPIFQKAMLPPSSESFHPEDGDSKALQNTGILPQYYMSQPSKP